MCVLHFRLNFTLDPRGMAAPAPPPLAAMSVSPSSPAHRPVWLWTWLLDGVKPASEHRQLHYNLEKIEHPQVQDQKNEKLEKNKGTTFTHVLANCQVVARTHFAKI